MVGGARSDDPLVAQPVSDAPLRDRMRVGKAWWAQDDRFARLAELWEGSDMSAREIGAMLGTTKNAVIGMAHRKGLTPRGASSLGAECAAGAVCLRAGRPERLSLADRAPGRRGF